jgi:adenylate cyclase
MSHRDSPDDRNDGQHAWAQRLWYAYLTGDTSRLDRKVLMVRSVFRRLPGSRRCKVCHAPFDGPSKALVAMVGFGAGHSSLNPSLCDRCEKIVKAHEVGMEVEVTLLFADVRGSTTLAEEVGHLDFHHLIGRFYETGTEALIAGGALIEKLIGDELAGIFAPGIAGDDHASHAIATARAILVGTGHGPGQEPWLPVGIGVHTGVVYAGAVGAANRMSVITVLGDAANTAARLASAAGPGEILLSDATLAAAGLESAEIEKRDLELKGKAEPFAVRVLRV